MKGQPCIKRGWRLSSYEAVPWGVVIMMLVFFGQFFGRDCKRNCGYRRDPWSVPEMMIIRKRAYDNTAKKNPLMKQWWWIRSLEKHQTGGWGAYLGGGGSRLCRPKRKKGRSNKLRNEKFPVIEMILLSSLRWTVIRQAEEISNPFLYFSYNR